jgi:hypothetical protein
MNIFLGTFNEYYLIKIKKLYLLFKLTRSGEENKTKISQVFASKNYSTQNLDDQSKSKIEELSDRITAVEQHMYDTVLPQNRRNVE